MKTYLTIDIGGTNLKYSLIREDGHLIEDSKAPSPQEESNFWQTFDGLIALYQNRIQGIAISIPGQVDAKKGIVMASGSLTFLQNIALGERMEQKFSLPTTIQNDGKAAALGEWWLGSLKGRQDAAILTLGTGVGGGLILDGRLRQGPHFQAGEMTFTFLNPAGMGFQKFSGGLCSAVNLVREINRILGHSQLDDGKIAFKAIAEGHYQVLPLFKEYCRYVASLVVNMQATVDLECVAIGGGISSQPLLVKEINAQYDQLLEENPIVKWVLHRPEICAAQLGNIASQYGALYHHLHS